MTMTPMNPNAVPFLPFVVLAFGVLAIVAGLIVRRMEREHGWSVTAAVSHPVAESLAS
jgi:hypothetical protein